MDDVLKAASLVCKLAVVVSLIFLAVSTGWLVTHGLPYQQPGLVVVTFTLPMVLLIAIADGLRLLSQPVDRLRLGAGKRH